MTIQASELQVGEREIDTWLLQYSPPGGGKFEGRCTITNQRILFVCTFDRDTEKELAELIESLAGNKSCIIIPKNRIREVETERSYLEKKVILTLDNGGKHLFSYGALNIDRLLQAINTTDNFLSHQ